MKKEKEVYYAAFKTKDARFDGRFFAGVSSTGIYCRPVCRAKLPKPENCTFYHTAAEAEQAGFRPCLLCRPELAPGMSPVDAVKSLAYKTVRIIEENCGDGENLKEIAKRLGCSDRHLRRTFLAEFNVSPVEYLQTCRLLLAKNLLTSTNLSVLDVSMAAGFGSLRRFNHLFKKRYKLVPTELRRETSMTDPQSDGINISLGYRPPYQWQKILDFLALRAIPGVEAVRDNEYMRTVHFIAENKKHIYGWVRVGHNPKKNALALSIDSVLLSVLPQVLSKIRHLFDLYCQPDVIYKSINSMNDIRPGLCVPGTRLPGAFDNFEMSVRAILGQQITVKGARTLASRLVEKYGISIKTNIESLTHVFPSPADIISLGRSISNHLGQLGITAARAKTILELAKAFERGSIDFDVCAQPETEIKKLMKISGIGEWTAQYIAMRSMGWPDAFLHTDYGIKKALEGYTSKQMLELSEKWRPWRSYATINLWNSL